MNQKAGYVVSWRVPSSVLLDEMRDAMTLAGLDSSMAKDFSPANIMNRALTEMKKDRIINRIQNKYKAGNNSTITFQINRVVLEQNHIEYPYEAEVCLDTATGAIISQSAEIEELARKLFSKYKTLRLANDITRIVQRIFDAHKADLIPIRDQGGAYFVPKTHEPLVDKTRQFLNKIGGKLNTLAVYLGDTYTEEAVAEHMSNYLSARIEEFREACKALHKNSRESTIQRRYETIVELRTKLELYRDVLAGFAKSISRELEEAEQFLIAQIASSKPAANEPTNQPASQASSTSTPVEHNNDDIDIDISPEELKTLLATLFN